MALAAAPVQAASIQTKLDGLAAQTSTPAQLIKNQTFLPLRDVSALFGATVNWQPAQTEINLGANKVVLKTGAATATQKGKTIQLPVKPLIAL